MPKRLCLVCSALIPGDKSFCRRHQPRRNPRRGTGWDAQRWSAKVLAKTRGRCAVPGCRTPLDRVQAHHLVALADGGPADGPGLAMCATHHQQATEEAKLRREKRSL